MSQWVFHYRQLRWLRVNNFINIHNFPSAKELYDLIKSLQNDVVKTKSQLTLKKKVNRAGVALKS